MRTKRFRRARRSRTLARLPRDSSPTSRALQALELLTIRPGATAADLAAHLGVSQRAARRYVAILRQADIPVQSARGRGGGYRLGRGTRLPPVSFTEIEALELVMAIFESNSGLAPTPGAASATSQPATVANAAPVAVTPDGVRSAPGKVIRVLPKRIGRPAAALRDHAAVAADSRPARPDAALTSTLVNAIAASRRVELQYRSAAGNEWSSEVEPWAVVVRHDRWYLLCRSLRADATRSYRLDRIMEVALTTTAFTPPAALDPVRMLENNLGEGWAYPTRVIFDAPATDVSQYIHRMGCLQAHPDGCVLTGTTNNPTMYACEWLAAIPIPFRIEGGAELHAAVTALARKSANAVRSPPSQAPTPRASPPEAPSTLPDSP